MKKILLSLCALAAITASAQDKQLVRIDNYSVTTDEAGVETIAFSYSGNENFYDKTNKIAMVQNGYSRMLYNYNAEGTLVSVDNYGWSEGIGWTLSNTTSYEYDTAGRVTKSGQFEAGTYSETTYDENGNTLKMENFYNGVSSYSATYSNQYNDKKQLVIADQLMADGSINQRTIYTYNEDGSVNTQETGYFVAEGEALSMPTTVTYTYNADGTVAKTRTVSNGRWGLMVSEEVYIYSAYATAYVPQNVKATGNADCTISLTWDAVEGATAYKVIYDKEVADAASTSFTTGMLLDGEHTFYVQAVIGGEAKNISDVAAASVKDNGKLPAANFKIVGVEVGEDQWGSPAYNTTVQFTLPEGHSEIKAFNVYYDLESAWSKVTVDPSTATIEGNTVTIVVPFSQYNVGTYNSETYEYDLGVKPIFVVITYASGDAEKSNVENWDFAANETSISAAHAASAPVAIYTASGSKVSSLQKGINIIKMSNNEVKKVLVK